MRGTGGADRNEDRECRLGTVRRGPDAVEAHRRHAFERADLPPGIFAIEQPPAEDDIKNAHAQALDDPISVRRETSSTREGSRRAFPRLRRGAGAVRFSTRELTPARKCARRRSSIGTRHEFFIAESKASRHPVLPLRYGRMITAAATAGFPAGARPFRQRV